MSDFKAQIHKIRSAGAAPQTPLGELTALPSYSAYPDALAVFNGPTSKRKAGKSEGKGREREREEKGE